MLLTAFSIFIRVQKQPMSQEKPLAKFYHVQPNPVPCPYCYARWRKENDRKRAREKAKKIEDENSTWYVSRRTSAAEAVFLFTKFASSWELYCFIASYDSIFHRNRWNLYRFYAPQSLLDQTCHEVLRVMACGYGLFAWSHQTSPENFGVNAPLFVNVVAAMAGHTHVDTPLCADRRYAAVEYR